MSNSGAKRLITYLLHEQSPSSEANRFAASQIPHILRNPKVHYRIHKCSPPVPIVSQLYPIHTPHLNIGVYIDVLIVYWHVFLPLTVDKLFTSLRVHTP
jgi:hypothetical protein